MFFFVCVRSHTGFIKIYLLKCRYTDNTRKMIEEVNLRKHGKGLIHFKAKGSSNPEKRKPDKYGNYLSSATNIKYNYPVSSMVMECPRKTTHV